MLTLAAARLGFDVTILEPEPDSPASPNRSPGERAKLTSSTARTLPCGWSKATRKPSTRRRGSLTHFASGEAIVRYEPAPPMTGTTGDIEALSMWAGQSVALARKPQPAADIVAELTSRL